MPCPPSCAEPVRPHLLGMQCELVTSRVLTGHCVAVAVCARAVVVSRNLSTPWTPRWLRAPLYANDPEFTNDDEWFTVDEDEHGPIDDEYGETDGDADGDLLVLDPDSLDQVRVIGSDVNPLGAFRFWKYSYGTCYNCGLAFEPLEDHLLVVDGRNAAVHVINVLDGTHAGFVATPRMCGYTSYMSGVAVKQTCPTTCVAAVSLPSNVLLVTHTRGGPWVPLTRVGHASGCDSLNNAVQFCGPGLSHVVAHMDPTCDWQLGVNTQSATNPLQFISDAVCFKLDKPLMRRGTVLGHATIRIAGVSEQTLLVASTCTPLAVLRLDGERTFPVQQCETNWVGVGDVPTAWASGPGSTMWMLKYESQSRQVLLRKYVPVIQPTRLAWMLGVVRAMCVVRVPHGP